MKAIPKILAALCLLATPLSLHAANGGDGGNGTAAGNGGAGLPGGRDGKPGMPGCGGGTNPSPDGKFYTSSGEACNPSDEDRRKLHTS